MVRDGAPEIVDGFDLSGDHEHFGGYPYVAAVYVLAPGDLQPLADALHASLAGAPGTLSSASAPAYGLCAARLLMISAPKLYRALDRETLGLPAPAREIA